MNWQQKEKEKLVEELGLFLNEGVQLFDDRQLGLIADSINYSKSAGSGIPGHNLMVIIDSLVDMVDRLTGELD